MGDTVPVLFGTAGLVAGETWVLPWSSAVSIGRSRSCAVSLRRSMQYAEAPAESRDEDHDFNTVSRRHLRISITAEGVATIEDLSSNGTLLRGQPVTGPATVDLAAGPVELRLGTRETFTLQLASRDDARVAGIEAVATDQPATDSSQLDSNTIRP